ncbi:MAG: stage V sporulation protein D [Peptococcaceae bacterium]|nr:stage V sporulation protein D [Peptococcaceae bacterium]
MQATNILIRKRIIVLFMLAVVTFFLLLGRLIWVQFFMGEQLRKQAIENRMREVPVEAKRGSICDRNGNELVTSVSADSVFAIPSQIKNPTETAQKLAAVLEIDPDTIYKKLTKKTSFEWIKRKVDFKVAKQLKEMDLPGIGFVEESKRYYLKDNLAAHVLGFVGIDNQGLTGIEKTFDKELRGIPGRIVMEYDAIGREIPTALHKYYPPVPGHSLVLTLDETIQYFVERELDTIVDTFHPANAVIIVMDPKTGGILAMGNRPSYDPNHWPEYQQSTWDRNPAIWYNYEPGSTFKIITLAAALEENLFDPDAPFYDPGYIKVADRRIRCWKSGGHGSETFAEVVQNSCNPGFITVGLDIGIPTFYEYVEAFGFGHPTDIDLPGEARGIMIPEKKATNLNLATMSIGQSIAVTPIQLITAVSAVVNGGKLMKPMLVQKVIDKDGNIVKEFEPQVVRNVLSPETCDKAKKLLEDVVLKGTGVNAHVEGYRVGGKTGTAQVVGPSGGYVSGRYVSSFVGFAPVEDPQVVILVVVSEPKGGVYFGSQVAAPAFRNVMDDTLHYLGVPERKDLPKPKKPWFWWQENKEPEEVAVPDVENLPLDEAVKELRGKGLNFMARGQGSIVYGQVPEAGARVCEGTTVILNLKAGERTQSGQVTVPDLSGLTIKQAGTLLGSLELRMEPVGSGVARSQSPAAGKKVERGTVVRVEFAPPAAESP